MDGAGWNFSTVDEEKEHQSKCRQRVVQWKLHWGGGASSEIAILWRSMKRNCVEEEASSYDIAVTGCNQVKVQQKGMDGWMVRLWIECTSAATAPVLHYNYYSPGVPDRSPPSCPNSETPSLPPDEQRAISCKVIVKCEWRAIMSVAVRSADLGKRGSEWREHHIRYQKRESTAMENTSTSAPSRKRKNASPLCYPSSAAGSGCM
ncbi:unnamed protein product [Calypogeia fissa]